MPELNRGVKFTYYGHATFMLESANGKKILIDPWVQSNPACPEHLKELPGFDLMLITHGHFDHIGDAVALAKKHKPKVVGIYETCAWLEKKGVENTAGMNKGGSQTIDRIKITMVHADHSCGILDDDGSIVYGGDPCGYVIRFENGFTVYHAGDTNVFSDMALIAELYQPELVMIPIGDHYTMSPLEAGKCLQLMKPAYCIPMHYGTFPVLTGTPDALKQQASGVDVEIIPLKPGDQLS